MNIRVKFFALARDIAGKDESVLSLPALSTAQAVLDSLIAQHPRFHEWKNHLRIAVNYEYVQTDQKLNENDEVAIIPPVSGG